MLSSVTAFLTSWIPGFSWLRLALVAAGALLIFLFYSYVTGVIDDNAQLRLDKQGLETRLTEAEGRYKAASDVIDQWKTSMDGFVIIVKRAAENSHEAAEELRRVKAFFNNLRLEETASVDPVAAEVAVNGGFSRTMRLLECASSAAGCGPAEAPDAPDAPAP